MLKFFSQILLLLFFCSTLLHADNLELQKIFQKYNVNGTLVISSLHNKENYVYNKKRAHERFCCASTFKIPHTLIALNEGLIKNENDTIKWDNVKREYDVWNKDQTLQSALAVSCVWCYQKFSKEISKEKYLEYLEEFNYGNKKVGLDKSNFWLDESLRISAYEQIDFLKKFYNNDLPVEKKYIDITKNILTVEKNNSYVLKAKSGWNGTIGWYVGYLQTGDKVYFFAMNGDINKNQLAVRKKIILDAFKALKLIYESNFKLLH